VLRAHVVADPDHVHAHPDQLLGRGQVVAIRDVQDRLGQVGGRHQVGQHPLVAAQRPRGLPDRGDRHAGDPILIPELVQGPLRVAVQLGPAGIGSMVLGNGAVSRQRVPDHLGVMAGAEGGLVRHRPPGHAPFIGIFIGVAVVAVSPADRGLQHVHAQRTLQLIGVAAAVRIVHRPRKVQRLPVAGHARLQPRRELRREADLHGTAIGLLMSQCRSDALAMVHGLLHSVQWGVMDGWPRKAFVLHSITPPRPERGASTRAPRPRGSP